MRIACGDSFRPILKEVRVCFSSSDKNFLHMDAQTRFHRLSVQSLPERVLEFEIFTTATRKFRVKLLCFLTAAYSPSNRVYLTDGIAQTIGKVEIETAGHTGYLTCHGII